MKKHLIGFIFQFFFWQALFSQADSILTKNIETITVAAAKINTTVFKAPLSITRLNTSVIQETRPQISLQEYLYNVPGIFTMNANNYAQDLRVSIRGFGARSAFGIRGIKIIVDGIPETTPDGQGQIDNLNLGIIQNMEIIRGPASSLYGNASGGIINVQTLNEFEKNYAKTVLTFGSFNLQQYQLTTGIKTEKTKFIFHGNRTSSDGYREHSRVENNNFNARIFHDFSDKSTLNILFNYADSPIAQDPGGIDNESVRDDRQQAGSNNTAFNAGEEIEQFKIGVNYTYEYDERSQFNTYAFYAARDFIGRLPFTEGGLVDLSREFVGTGGNYNFTLPLSNGINKLQIGYEMAAQADNRLRFQNKNGVQDSLTFDQLEAFTTAGIYLINHFSLNDWLFSFGLRHDWNKINVQDRFKENGDGSGDRNLSSWNPSVGINYEILPDQYLFTNFSTSFETPALSELSANPNSMNGFNQLDAQRAFNYEWGIKGRIKNKLQYDVAIFHIDTKNELVPFELDTFPGRLFFRNSGKGSRNGLEVAANYAFNKVLSFAANYTFSDFNYDQYELSDSLNYNGNNLPGIPKHYATFTCHYKQEKGWHGNLQMRYVGELFANDPNTVTDEAYVLLNLNLGYTLQRARYSLTPFFGVNNILNTEYNDNIRINAFGGRFFEPGPGVNIYGGVRFKGEW